jgi:hypothetical protein
VHKADIGTGAVCACNADGRSTRPVRRMSALGQKRTLQHLPPENQICSETPSDLSSLVGSGRINLDSGTVWTGVLFFFDCGRPFACRASASILPLHLMDDPLSRFESMASRGMGGTRARMYSRVSFHFAPRTFSTSFVQYSLERAAIKPRALQNS